MSGPRPTQIDPAAPSRPHQRDEVPIVGGGAEWTGVGEAEELRPTRRLHPGRQFLGYLRFYVTAIRDPRLTPIVGAAMGVILLGTLFYWRQEGWSLLDAFYFSVITLATVGYGDFAPRTALGKLFTTGYVLVGVGLLGSFLSLLVHRATELARHPSRHRDAPTPAEKEPPAHW
jgi:hypothetical protein